MKILERVIAIAICLGVAILCAMGVLHYSMALPTVKVAYVIVCGAAGAVSLVIGGLLMAELLRK